LGVALGVTVGLGAGCKRNKTDEELLREKIDCVCVHLYVATKVAVLRAPTDPAAQNARAQLMAAVQSGSRIIEAALPSQHAGDAGVAAPAAAPMPSIELADVARFATALWGLRAEGARIVRSGREDEMQPVLPLILAGGQSVPAWAAHIDLQTEHALFLMVLLGLRLHPRVPIPIPPEMILYEASRTDAARSQLPGFEPVLRGAKAYVFAIHELCDLASREASAMDRITFNAELMQRSMSTLAGGRTVRPQDSRVMDLSFRALGHGASAACYAKRGDDAQMKEELRRFVDSLHSLGVPPEETGVIRAFLAHENNDTAGARAALADARRMRELDPDTRSRIEAMDRALAANDRDAMTRQFDRGQLALLTGRVVYRQVERSGALDAIANEPSLVRVRSYLTATNRSIDAARGTVGATATGAERRARGIIDRFWR
jgi:hypothetical protein